MFLPKNRVDIAEWFGVITGILGAVIISSNIGYVEIGYIIFSFSAVSMMYFARKLNRWPLFTMNVIFLAINFWGIWRWL